MVKEEKIQMDELKCASRNINSHSYININSKRITFVCNDLKYDFVTYFLNLKWQFIE